MFMTSINRKVMAGYTAIVLTVIIVGVFLTQKSNLIGLRSHHFISELLPGIQQIETVSSGLDRQQLAAFSLYGTVLDVDTFDDQIRSAEDQMRTALDVLFHRDEVDGAKGQSALNSFRQSMTSLRLAMTSTPVQWDEAREYLANLQQARDTLQQLLMKQNARASEEARLGADEVQRLLGIMQRSILMAAAVIIALIIAAFIGTRRGIVDPVVRLSADLLQSAQTLDLTRPLVSGTRDELSGMADAVSQLQSTFRDSINTSKSSAQELMASAGELEQLADEVKRRIHQFSGYMERLTGQVSNFEANILSAADKSRHASDEALGGARQAEAGALIVHDAARGINELSQDLEVSSEMLLALKASGNQVGAVVSTIAEIAEQTNLLALNAAIEAARAGETGRGFAVVADEVRLLATRTHQSTHQINEILATIVQSITAVVASMDSNRGKASTTVESVRRTVESLEALQATILRLSDENQSLVQLAQSNEQGIASMRDHIGDVVKINADLAAGGDSVHRESAQLLTLAGVLNSVAGRFRS